MSTNIRLMSMAAFTIAGLLATGCGRNDTRADSDPPAGLPSAADSGRPVHGTPENSQPKGSGSASTAPTTGTDSTGRPSDASGGTTGAGAGSGTSGTQTSSGGETPKAR